MKELTKKQRIIEKCIEIANKTTRNDIYTDILLQELDTLMYEYHVELDLFHMKHSETQRRLQK